MSEVISQKPVRFLSKLREVLSRPDEYGHSITWVRDGKAIQIPDEERFPNSGLKKAFPYTNFKSFIRQLNVYGFKKTMRNLNERIYCHPQFNKHQPELTDMIKRKPRKKKLQHFKETSRPRLPSIYQVLEVIRHVQPNPFVPKVRRKKVGSNRGIESN